MLNIEKKYTEKDYVLLSEGMPFQLINYDLVMSPSPTPQHQLIAGKLFNLIVNFLEQTGNNGAVMFAPVDVVFDEGNIFQPDLIFISGQRKNELIRNRIEGAPDMVIEILSPSNAYYDLRQKKDVYEQFGVKEYIIIDPIQQIAEIYVLEQNRYLLYQKSEKTEKLEPVTLPGLVIHLTKIFQ